MNYFDHFVKSPGTPIGNWIKRKSRLKVFKILTRFLRDKNSKILEIGPGFGELAELFRASGYDNYTLVEPNPTFRAKLIADGFIVKNYLIPNLNEKNNSLDAIILVDVFEHLDGPSGANQFLLEARRVLGKNGLLCIFCPDYLHWKSDFFNSDFSHSNITTIRRTMQLLNNFGINIVYMEYFSGFITGILATLLSYFVRVTLFFLNGNSINNKTYKIKLVFLRQFLIVGTKLMT